MSYFGGNGHDPRRKIEHFYHNKQKPEDRVPRWEEIKVLMNKNIIKVDTGFDHSLFLQDDGTLWCCGNNSVGELGLGHNEWIFEPVPIPFFVINKIRIKQVKCGSNHHLALDDRCFVYSWGCNKFGQCGDGKAKQCLNTPRLIEFFANEIVKGIDCGSFHSYCRTEEGKHYLFGSNYENECVTFNDKQEKVMQPFCINDNVYTHCGGKQIKAIYLGHFNTKIVV